LANLDRIKDVTLEYAEKYAQRFAANAPVKTGRLKNSYRASVSEQGDKLNMQIFGEFYGPFQSYGVGGTQSNTAIAVPAGINPPPSLGVGNTYQFKQRRIGLNPTNYIQNSIDQVTPEFVDALEEAGVEDVNEFFKGLSMIDLSK
jgi:hypothetical protein